MTNEIKLKYSEYMHNKSLRLCGYFQNKFEKSFPIHGADENQPLVFKNLPMIIHNNVPHVFMRK